MSWILIFFFLNMCLMFMIVWCLISPSLHTIAFNNMSYHKWLSCLRFGWSASACSCLCCQSKCFCLSAHITTHHLLHPETFSWSAHFSGNSSWAFYRSSVDGSQHLKTSAIYIEWLGWQKMHTFFFFTLQWIYYICQVSFFFNWHL